MSRPGAGPWFAIGADPAAVDAVERLATPLGQSVRRAADLDALRNDDAFRAAKNPFVVIADKAAGPNSADALLAFLDGQPVGGTFVFVADHLDGERYKRLLRSGRAEWLSWTALASELPALARGRGPVSSEPSTSRLWGVLPSKGGSGVTTVSVELAFGLSERRSRRDASVAVAELDILGGTLSDALDVEPRLDLSGLLDQPDRLDARLIEAFASRFSPRLDVFASPRRWLDPRRLDPPVLFAMLDLLAGRYRDVIVGIPTGWHSWLDDLVTGVDGVVVCGDDTVPGVRQLRNVTLRLAELGLARNRIAVVINRCELDVFGRPVRRSELERALPGQQLFWIRNDATTVSHAQNSGQPLAQAAAGSRIGKDFRILVDWLDSPQGSPEVVSSSDGRMVGA